MRASRGAALDACVLCVLSSLLYLNTLHADFTYDDQYAILSNADVVDAANYRGGDVTVRAHDASVLAATARDRATRESAARDAAEGEETHAASACDAEESRGTDASSCDAAEKTTTTTTLADVLVGPAFWTRDFWGQDLRDAGSHKSWRPLTVLSFRVNAAVGGAEPTPRRALVGAEGDARPVPFGFHLGNVSCHAIATCLACAPARPAASRRSVFHLLRPRPVRLPDPFQPPSRGERTAFVGSGQHEDGRSFPQPDPSRRPSLFFVPPRGGETRRARD